MAVPQANKALLIGGVLLAGGLIYWWWRGHETPPPPPPRRVEAPPPPVQVPDARVEPQIQHPIEKVRGRTSGPLPGLDDSDRDMRERLGSLFGARKLAELFFLDGIIRRIVATVDNLPREQVSPSLWAIKPTPGEFQVEPRGATMTISPKNGARYDPRVRMIEAVDTHKLVAVYVRHYMLFQQAYQELGYPQGYFNDRLVEVIDHLIAAPDANGPMTLVRQRNRYEFADPELQRRSAGQKFLLRLGPERAARVKAVLREIRGEVTGQSQRR